MKWLNYKDSSIDTIESVEHRLQITLPDDFKKFVLKYDGGFLILIILRWMERWKFSIIY